MAARSARQPRCPRPLASSGAAAVSPAQRVPSPRANKRRFFLFFFFLLTSEFLYALPLDCQVGYPTPLFPRGWGGGWGGGWEGGAGGTPRLPVPPQVMAPDNRPTSAAHVFVPSSSSCMRTGEVRRVQARQRGPSPPLPAATCLYSACTDAPPCPECRVGGGVGWGRGVGAHPPPDSPALPGLPARRT